MLIAGCAHKPTTQTQQDTQPVPDSFERPKHYDNAIMTENHQEGDSADDSARKSNERYLAGLVAYSEGDKDLAIVNWKEALILDPSNKKAELALTKVLNEKNGDR